MSTATVPAVSLESLLASQRAAFRQNPYPTVKQRRANLKRLQDVLFAAQPEVADALDRDFGGRCRREVEFSELFVALNAIRHSRKQVAGWMKRRPRHVEWPLQPARAWVMPQPVGVVGIIVPWNYPIFLTMAPLAGALAAGNRVMLKLSEFTPATSDRTARLIAETFPPDLVAVVTGPAEVGRAFASLPFDHLLFTGSTAVGRQVMRAAAENLTPVTLELGGKSPAILAPDANIESASRDIAYGKFLNAGQTCIAPDYALVERSRLEPFIDAMRRSIERYWPSPAQNSEYTSLINSRHQERLAGYVREARERGLRVVLIGPEQGSSRRMAPTLIIDPPADLAVMRDEIFGPVFPVKTYVTLDEAIDYVNDRDRPLALYLFTKSAATRDNVLKRTVSGAACVNDTLIYIAAEDLPFGGAGASGFGHYHGQEGFDTFSKLKPVFTRPLPGLGRMTRPPYGGMHALLKRILIG
ncbi:MAG: coniferyl aldehyde dehydrogenase [Acidobacteria bacterium]|nr:coniferyl aldehyde dehydrogenase [Acidobacteriota bacterium]